MATNYSNIDAALQRFGFYRLDPSAPLPNRDAVMAEAAIAGFVLPDDYAYFCSCYGAGAFDRHAMLPLPAGCPLGPDFRLDILYAIGARDDCNPLALLNETYQDRLPPALLPIGTDPGGNLLLLGTEHGTGIHVWDHEHRELADGEFDRRCADLRRIGIDVEHLDVDQLLLMWEQTFPDRVESPSGHGNLYRVTASFSDLCDALQADDSLS
jgi:hypothetical protein